MAVDAPSMLLILPAGQVGHARVTCCECGGQIVVDLSSARLQALVALLAEVHVCPLVTS